MADPSYRKIVNDGRRERESMAGQAAAVVRDLLNATNSDGSPNQELRRKGAELFVKNPKLFDVEDTPDDTVLPGTGSADEHRIRSMHQSGGPDPNNELVSAFAH
jgi:hypothetical protein